MPAVTDTGFVEMRLRKVVGIGRADDGPAGASGPVALGYPVVP